MSVYFVANYEFSVYFEEEFQILISEIRGMNIRDDKNNEYIRQNLASAYYNVVNGYSGVAIGELRALKNKLIYKNYIMWISASLICNIVQIAVFTLVILVIDEKPLNEMAYCIISDCIGCFLVSSKMENGTITHKYLPIVDATISFFASCVSGFIMYCILKSNLILGAFSENIYGMIMVCFIAGYNEDIPLKLLRNITGMLEGTKFRSKS